MATAEQIPSMLAGLVRRYQVCWDVWPERLIVDGKERQVGFELELSGTPEAEAGNFGLASPACHSAYNALHAIADWILPKDQRSSTYEVGPYERSLRYSAAHGGRPDVTLSVKILHRQGFDQPVDQCEIRCLEEMTHRLTQLGACQHQWTSRKA